jgi:MFS family permease
VARGGAAEQAAKTTFRDVFAVAEFRALWLAQLLSVVGDQLARLALTVLVYDRTRSALLAAITFVVSLVPAFIGGVTLAWLADRYPRRGVMISCDLVRCVLVLVMAIPGVPLAGLVALLFVVTLVGAPFTSARAAVYPDVLTGDRYVVGTAVTITTYQFAQVVGFAVGGATVTFFGTRPTLLVDAATFIASALIVLCWVRPRSAPAVVAGDDRAPSRLAGIFAGTRLVLARPSLRTPMLFGWLAAFYNAPEGVVTPLARDLGGGAAAVGVLLAANSLGQTVGALVLSRFVAPSTRLRFMGPLAVAACAVLALFFWRPGLPATLLILFASGLFASYQLAANAAFVTAAPQEQRSQAFGLAQGGMSLGQGVVMILAGAAADHHSPALVIAVAGAVGAMVALAVVVSWVRGVDGSPSSGLQQHTLKVRSSCRRAWRAPRGGVGGGRGFGSGPVVVAHGVLPPLCAHLTPLSN